MKSQFWFRLIALFKILKGILMIGISFGIFRLVHANLETLAINFFNSIRIDPDNHYIHAFLIKFTNLSPATIERFGIGALIYSVLLLTEGLGLWFSFKWAKYLVIIATSLLIPLEIYEIFRHPTAIKGIIFLLNIAIVIYLLSNVLGQSEEPSTQN